MLLAIHLIIVGLFVLLALLFWNGKGAFLIAGYNTAPREEKEKIDEQKLCKCMGKLMLLLAACWLVVAGSEVFALEALHWVGLALFCAVLIGGVVYMNTGNRFRR